jgi:hypothetical protein
MSDADLERKFHGLSDGIVGAQRASELLAACWSLGEAADLRALTSLARP